MSFTHASFASSSAASSANSRARCRCCCTPLFQPAHASRFGAAALAPADPDSVAPGSGCARRGSRTRAGRRTRADRAALAREAARGARVDEQVGRRVRRGTRRRGGAGCRRCSRPCARVAPGLHERHARAAVRAREHLARHGRGRVAEQRRGRVARLEAQLRRDARERSGESGRARARRRRAKKRARALAIIGAASSSIATKITMFSILRAPALAEISAILCSGRLGVLGPSML